MHRSLIRIAMKYSLVGIPMCVLCLAVMTGCSESEPAVPAEAKDINPFLKPEDRLIHAVEKEDVAAVSEALNTGSEPNSPGSGELPPLEVAAARGFVEGGRLLLARGADIDRVGISKVPGEQGKLEERRGNSALHTAVATGQLEFVKFLIENKANLNLRNGRDSTPLDIAKNSAEMLQAREELATDPEMIADIAARMARTQEVIKLLEEHGAQTTQSVEAKKLEDIKGGGIIGRLPPEIQGATTTPQASEKPPVEPTSPPNQPQPKGTPDSSPPGP